MKPVRHRARAEVSYNAPVPSRSLDVLRLICMPVLYALEMILPCAHQPTITKSSATGTEHSVTAFSQEAAQLRSFFRDNGTTAVQAILTCSLQ